jgi:anti-sigma B factor antagonist
MSSFRVTEETADGDVQVVAVAGYVDFDAAPELKRSIVRLMDAGHRDFIVDLTEAGFIDSTGIGVLVGALKRLREAGGSLVVVCPSEDMLKLFRVIGLEDVIPVYRGRENALGAFATAA